MTFRQKLMSRQYKIQWREAAEAIPLNHLGIIVQIWLSQSMQSWLWWRMMKKKTMDMMHGDDDDNASEDLKGWHGGDQVLIELLLTMCCIQNQLPLLC